MIDEKIIAAYEKVKDTAPTIMRSPPMSWVILFNYYNKNHPGQRPLGMGCRICYTKVREFVATQILQHDPRTII